MQLMLATFCWVFQRLRILLFEKGIGAKVLGIDHPELKKCFKDFDHAKEVFKKELQQNLEDLQKHGLFFSFTTDPMLPETIELTKEAIAICVQKMSM